MILSFTEHAESNPVSEFESPTYRMLKPNTNATITSGSTILLQCYFHHNVNCVWVRRGILIYIGQRYAYEFGNGVATTDCTLMIRNFTDIDIGEWQCESLGDDNTLSIKGSSAQLSIVSSSDLYSTRPTSSSHSKLPQIVAFEQDDWEMDIPHNGSVGMIAAIVILTGALIAVLAFLLYKLKKLQT